MRFAHPGGETVHLAYCSNVHAAEDAAGIVTQLERFAGPVRERLGSERLGIGLWLAADAGAELRRDADALERLRGALADGGLEVVTFNAFPYRGFHAPVVKEAVYRPDWTAEARIAYTLDVAALCAALLPEDVEEGSVSTMPLGWHEGWSDSHRDRARGNLDRVAVHLAELHRATGKRIRVGIEPEPSCVVETVGEAVEALSGADSDWVGIALDACHHAVAFDEAAASLRALEAGGIRIVKCQLSNALRAAEPGSDAGRARLESFVEPRFLHQTREPGAARGEVLGTDDLPEALAGGLPAEREWRVHFHVPVHEGGEETTQSQLRSWMSALVGGPTPLVRHLEVETYTWTVLPEERRPVGEDGLVDGLARELSWTRDELLGLGLSELPSTPEEDLR